VLLDQTQDVDHAPKDVWVEDLSPYLDNTELRAQLDNRYGSKLQQTNTGDMWHQDGYEIGYARAPYGWIHVFLVSPRASRDGNLLKAFVHNDPSALGPGAGVCWRLEQLPWTDFDGYGNLECKAASSAPGEVLYGRSLNAGIQDFLAAQAVNARRAVNTDWLEIGHVDEIICFSPDGDATIVADPEVCWGLLLWAASVVPAAFYPLHGVSVATVLGATSGLPGVSRRDFNLLSSNPQFVMHPANLPSVRADLGLPAPESDPVPDPGNAGTAALAKGGEHSLPSFRTMRRGTIE